MVVFRVSTFILLLHWVDSYDFLNLRDLLSHRFLHLWIRILSSLIPKNLLRVFFLSSV